MPAQASVRPVKQEAMSDFWTLGGWVSSSLQLKHFHTYAQTNCSVKGQRLLLSASKEYHPELEAGFKFLLGRERHTQLKSD